ncbi:uracil-xanthine permease family protein [Adlercreutzia faecimuris]|uniref:Uracil-xanthine permease family protein n=1 Tax=Adlercreutzia faecimuris TaxID=2897341 RepID=A0ABS9WHY8_9ACTN|nr:uracil-xanthine permease family protein [Adlercreutzia sp. JBNU-10]MCI2242493.1 uracil-xanthine permease family protein [Adlercreutzia sp. JBNU-10]
MTDRDTSQQASQAGEDAAVAGAAPGAPVFDARSLGAPKMALFGLQHMFAMFGATILVPTLTGLSVSATLLFAGIGTLLFHLISKGQVPAFLGSSFAFIAGYAAIAPNGEPELLPYACLGVACAGLLYLVLSALFRVFGPLRVMRFFPPVVTGPIVISIGLILASSAIANCETNWLVALVAIAIIVVANIWGRGMIRIIPILLGVIGAYVVAALLGEVDFAPVAEAAWIGLPVLWDDTVFSLIGPGFDAGLAITAIITIMPLAFATMIEHIGDMSAISSTCGRNYIASPGLHRTLLGDGLATILASLFGAPANTTYGENTGVLALTRVFDPRVVRLAALFAIVFSFCPKFAAVIAAMPACVIGGVSLVLYGMISAVGIRNLVENRVDFTRSRNVLITAIVLVLSLGIAYSATGAITLVIGGVAVGFSGLAVGSVAGILLNVVLPDDGAPTAEAVDELAAQPASRPLRRAENDAAPNAAASVAAGAQPVPGAQPAPRALEDELENDVVG